MQTVYRIEYADGEGPYQGERDSGTSLTDIQFNVRDKLMDAHAGSEIHPSLWMDCNIQDVHHSLSPKDYYCGFLDLKQYEEWFDGFLKILHEAGAVLRKYIVEDKYVIIGEYQICFAKCEASLAAESSPII